MCSATIVLSKSLENNRKMMLDIVYTTDSDIEVLIFTKEKKAFKKDSYYKVFDASLLKSELDKATKKKLFIIDDADSISSQYFSNELHNYLVDRFSYDSNLNIVLGYRFFPVCNYNIKLFFTEYRIGHLLEIERKRVSSILEISEYRLNNKTSKFNGFFFN